MNASIQMNMPLAGISPFPPVVSWTEILWEGERRISSTIVDALVLTPVDQQRRLLSHRLTVKREMENALRDRNHSVMIRVLKGQIRLLNHIQKILCTNGVHPSR